MGLRLTGLRLVVVNLQGIHVRTQESETGLIAAGERAEQFEGSKADRVPREPMPCTAVEPEGLEIKPPTSFPRPS